MAEALSSISDGGAAARRRTGRRIDWIASIPFLAVHAGAVIGVALTGWSWRGVLLALGLYYGRMLFVTAGYHRYFSHRAFRTSRPVQFLLAFFAMTSSQKGVLWWAAHHRVHHKLSDKPGDVHSVLLDGFFYSHVGWILSRATNPTNTPLVKDFARFPELRWLNTYWQVPPVVLAIVLYLVGGTWALVWGFFVSTTLLWHGTFTINSLTHMFGRRRYATDDNSRNSAVLAAVTLGEGWHNNHHYYQRSANQGFYWWEFDPTFYVLRLLQLFGVVWDVHTTPAHVREAWRGDRAPRAARAERPVSAGLLPKPL